MREVYAVRNVKDDIGCITYGSPKRVVEGTRFETNDFLAFDLNCHFVIASIFEIVLEV